MNDKLVFRYIFYKHIYIVALNVIPRKAYTGKNLIYLKQKHILKKIHISLNIILVIKNVLKVINCIFNAPASHTADINIKPNTNNNDRILLGLLCLLPSTYLNCLLCVSANRLFCNYLLLIIKSIDRLCL